MGLSYDWTREVNTSQPDLVSRYPGSQLFSGTQEL